jgi:uncharacterized protein YecE (DUF72 family)
MCLLYDKSAEVRTTVCLSASQVRLVFTPKRPFPRVSRSYGSERLARWAQTVASWLAEAPSKQSFLYFNNDATTDDSGEPSAIADSRALAAHFRPPVVATSSQSAGEVSSSSRHSGGLDT